MYTVGQLKSPVCLPCEICSKIYMAAHTVGEWLLQGGARFVIQANSAASKEKDEPANAKVTYPNLKFQLRTGRG